MKFVQIISGEPEDESGAFLIDVVLVSTLKRATGFSDIMWFNDGKAVYVVYDSTYPHGKYSVSVKYYIDGVGYTNIPEQVRQLVSELDLDYISSQSKSVQFVPECC